ncbi:putative membrane protein [Chryseobacterium defluvii]|uniref:Putative membrane protein n=1 Tax=Chryseobacterium defluvii TaxID=160396 RepID=A0A840KHW8_9FLAO|nr:DUF1648 domain-containing protein [Chryseobacterium defluvii]MBB4807618.1 putative membrane protein [Chryseobacterium defluvii]
MVSRILLGINIILLIFIWGFTGLKYGELPEIIPTHFNSYGNIDGEDHKKMIWLLPSIATFIFFVLIAVTKDPRSPMLNIPDNFRDKKTLELFSYTILIPILLLFWDMLIETVLIAQGRIQALSNLAFVLLGFLFLTLGTWVFIMIRKGKSANPY